MMVAFEKNNAKLYFFKTNKKYMKLGNAKLLPIYQVLSHINYIVPFWVYLLYCTCKKKKKKSFWYCFSMPGESYCVYATLNEHFASICKILHVWIGYHDKENGTEV